MAGKPWWAVLGKQSDPGALADQECVPCKGGVPPLSEEEYAPLLAQLEGWEVRDGLRLDKSYRFKDFAEALDFVNRVGRVAEEHGHHPDLHLYWGRVDVELTTHKIKGLSSADFVMAAKIDRVAGAAAAG
jgi:4a-hydroxytetrahydrobiopterin dehydratase